MAPIHSPDDTFTGPERPSQQSIAFAISVVLSKPEGLNVKEYIRLLRQHIAPGRRENAISSVYRHLDRSSYWRGEYERVKETLQTAEGETVDLRGEIDRLKAQVESAKARCGGAGVGAGVSKKRKKVVDEDVVPMPRSPKKIKRDKSPVRRGIVVEREMVDVERDFDFADVGEIGNILMRSLYQVNTVLKSHHRTEAAVLAHHLVRAASALPQVVQQAVRNSFARLLTGAELLKTTLTAASRAFATLIVGIDRLGHVAEGAEVQGQVVYTYVQMFAALLDVLSEASKHELKKVAVLEASAAAEKRPTTSKGKTRVQQPKQPNLKDVSSLNAITCFICAMIDLLDAKLDVHKQLFEGFAYCTLNKLGSRLYTCVFGQARGQTIEHEIMASNQPDEIEDSPPQSSAYGKDVDMRKAKMEAPYLIHLLIRLMAAAPEHLGALIKTPKTSKAKTATSKSSVTKGALAIHAKERLQRTLVNCIFGTEGVEKDDELLDCLKMPSPCEKALPMPKVKEVEVQEWFKEEVWRLVGWEVLGKEGGW